MTKPELTAIVHVFSNGAGLIEFDEQVRPEQIDNFKQYWQSAQRKERGAAIHMVGGVRLTIVEHQSPLGPDFTFDAISHAFGALGEYKEDEEIEAFVEALKTFAAET